MMNNTKLKHLLKNHTVGLSLGSEGWGLTVISIADFKRKNYTGASFCSIIDQAYKEMIKNKKLNGTEQQN